MLNYLGKILRMVARQILVFFFFFSYKDNSFLLTLLLEGDLGKTD